LFGSSTVLVEPGERRIGYEANPLIWKAVGPTLSRAWRPEPRQTGRLHKNRRRTLFEIESKGVWDSYSLSRFCRMQAIPSDRRSGGSGIADSQ